MPKPKSLSFRDSLKLWTRRVNPLHLSEDYSREVVFAILACMSCFVFLSLLSYSPLDPSQVSQSSPPRTPQNWGGYLGSHLAGVLVYYLGICSLFLPIPLPLMSYNYLKRQPLAFAGSKFYGWVLLILSTSSLVARHVTTIPHSGIDFPAAGIVGDHISRFLILNIGHVGHEILAITALFCSFILISRRPLISMAARSIKKPSLPKPQLSNLRKKKKMKPALSPDPIAEEEPTTKSEAPDIEIKPLPQVPSSPSENKMKPETRSIAKPLQDLFKKPQSKSEPLVVLNEQQPEPAAKDYQPPPLSLFKTNEHSSKMTEEQRLEFQETAKQLVAAFGEFNITGKVIAIQPGPVVAVYEFQPEAGTKLSKMTGLIEDIALALKVDSIFIHPVSGKRALGIQVPNRKREIVFLGDIVKAPGFQKSTSPLTFAMGKNLSGEPISEDLAKMPHLLVAGQTGSGKSVAINSLLCSIILKSKPDQVKMVLVDPKILELKIYEGIPHLLMPVITEAPKASLALKWACYEMDRRYKLMELARVRHISGFNEYWQKANTQERQRIKVLSEQDKVGELPFIVIVIDELADLMLTAPKDVESSIQRLAQKARASGIHLVLATQRPSVDVITGVIKANLPCRISFKVFSRGDSRTILDSMGAERLLGKGDMLFLKPGTSRLHRIQGAFLEDHEVVSMVESIKEDSEECFDETAISWIEEEYERQSGGDTPAVGDSEEDPKWDHAIAVAQKQGAVSASYLQRTLKIGYNRAARIVEAMEHQGLVGSADGSKPRKWLGPT
ncbi:DNA translocase FtsK [Pseudobacteriovorax antillogorgiicola]|uniref:DNA segregation ATPase FtsK/SpoIIIE, S-DNA-T family n=1 Tax=Pseudobacteriovorax antillogorgiicola TaxID=1513793 RepID=A0A1Y6B4J8_9BACT|nr:DNA translocase FtsK [Pseudobacteriovorax antillogorgiicola]TCS59119.1 S-DNA-T family DNA segregation ATPase FtsK/SpoIIIE [Pseudobacteriovorax antillogorgiicola]SME91612.1 DNA segregation ATPase FtsK/SpoIIIE, S-DNA-T family [Pseudobacteriovorax antillogorgiicola]